MIMLIIEISLGLLTGISITLMTFMRINIMGVNAGAILLALVISYLIFSFGMLKVGEVGMLSAFGKSIGNVGPGLFFAPWGIVSVRKEAGTTFQDELPADPEKIFRGEGKVPDGMFPPMRVKFGQPDPEDTNLKDDPYNVPMVAEVVPVVSWHIDDPTTFFEVIGNVANCRKILTDKAVEVFGDEFAKITPAKAMLNLDNTSQILQKKLEKEVSDWGIKINDAYVKPVIFSHGLNEAVESVSKAREGAKAVVLAANGAAEAKVLNAGATQKELLATGLATAKGTKTIKALDGKDFIFEEVNLNPDANTRVRSEAIGGLKDVKGTVVLGDPNVMLGIKKGGDQ